MRADHHHSRTEEADCLPGVGLFASGREDRGVEARDDRSSADGPQLGHVPDGPRFEARRPPPASAFNPDERSD
jgi:hypothetical protein